MLCQLFHLPKSLSKGGGTNKSRLELKKNQVRVGEGLGKGWEKEGGELDICMKKVYPCVR